MIEPDERHPTIVFEVTGFFGPPWKSFDHRPRWWTEKDYEAAKREFRVGERFAHMPMKHNLRFRNVELVAIDEAARGDQYRAVLACPVCTPPADITDNRKTS